MEWAKNKAELWNGKIPNMKGKKLKEKEKRKIKYENHSCYRKKVLVIMYKKWL